MKPNVLFIIDSFEQGGSERQALQLLTQLHESGRVNVRLACLQDKGSLKADAERLGIGQIHEYPLTSFYDLNFAKQIRRLVRYIKENQIDVVHTHCFYTNIFGMTGAYLARVPARITSKGETDGFRSPMQKRAERRRTEYHDGQRLRGLCAGGSRREQRPDANKDRENSVHDHSPNSCLPMLGAILTGRTGAVQGDH